MRKHWVGLLSMLGLAGSVMPAVSQVLKGATPAKNVADQSKTKLKKSRSEKTASAQARHDKWKKGAAETTSAQSNAAKKQLQLHQETLRTQEQQNVKGDKNALTKAGLTKAALTKGTEQPLTKTPQ